VVRKGLIILPRIIGIDERPRMPVPFTIRRRNVSTWSSRVWPMAILSKWSASAISSKKQYRMSLPACCMDLPDFLAS